MMKFCIDEKVMWGILAVGAIAGAAMIGWQVKSDWQMLPVEEQRAVLSKSEVESLASTFVKKHFDVESSSFEVVSTLTAAALPDTFLMRSYLSPSDQTIYRNKYLSAASVYTVRFYKFEEIEEFSVTIDAYRGDVIYFDQILPEDSNISESQEDGAVSLSQSVVSNMTGAPIEELTLHSKDQETLPGGIERNVTLKWQGSEVDSEFGKGFVTFVSTVRGDKVTAFYPSYEYPEPYERALEKSSTVGGLVGFASLLAWLFIIVGALVVMIKSFTAHTAKWKLTFGVTAILALLGVVEFVNQLPEAMMWYTTTDSVSVHWIFSILITIMAILVTSLMFFLPSVAGETIASEQFKARIHPLQNLPLGKEIKTSYRLSLLRGYLLGIFFLGFTLALYWVGEEYLGVWYPYGTGDDMLGLGGFVPAFSLMLSLGLTAAITEEVTFRLFGILWISKLTKSTVAGVLIATAVWAFAHTDGSVLPVWFRGGEVLMGGLLFAYFFMRYNILTTIVAHYIHNIIIACIMLLFAFGTAQIMPVILIFCAPAFMYVCFEIAVNSRNKAK